MTLLDPSGKKVHNRNPLYGGWDHCTIILDRDIDHCPPKFPIDASYYLYSGVEHIGYYDLTQGFRFLRPVKKDERIFILYTGTETVNEPPTPPKGDTYTHMDNDPLSISERLHRTVMDMREGVRMKDMDIEAVHITARDLIRSMDVGCEEGCEEEVIKALKNMFMVGRAAGEYDGRVVERGQDKTDPRTTYSIHWKTPGDNEIKMSAYVPEERMIEMIKELSANNREGVQIVRIDRERKVS